MGRVILCLIVFISNLLPGLIAYNDPSALDIAAFNVRIFGKAKMSKPIVVNNLKEIILRYDIFLIQEIRDSSGKAIKQLLSLVNQASSVEYGLTISKRLGRTSSKEQYAFLYRKDWIEVVDTYQHDDPDDVFEREPFAIKVSSPKTSVQTFGIVAIHTAPRDAEREISELASVYDDVRLKFGTDNIIITDCPYDRIVVAGSNLVSSIFPLSAGVLYFDEIFNLNDKTTQDISDHYPVHMQIETLKERQDIAESKGMSVYEKHSQINESEARSAGAVAEGLGYTVSTFYSESDYERALIIMEKSITSKTNLYNELEIILQNFSDIVTPLQIDDVKRYMVYESTSNFLPRGFGKFKTLRDYYLTRERVYHVIVSCDILIDETKRLLKLSSKFL